MAVETSVHPPELISIRTSPNAKLVVDERGVVVAANAAAEALFGYGEGELLGMSIEAFVPPRTRDAHEAHRASFAARPSTRPMGVGRDLTALRRDGREVPVEIGLGPMVDGRVVVSIVDLTLRKRMEHQLRQSNKHLEEFTYVASHDLRSPLRGIADLLEWIEEDLDAGDVDAVRRNVGRARLRVSRLERIIDDLLRYARAGQRDEDIALLDLASVVQEICDVDPPPSTFRVEVDIQGGAFHAPRTPVQAVLRNLLGNALKHHDQGAGVLRVRSYEEPAYRVIEVTDDGPGIPEMSHARVFRMFQTVSVNDGDTSGVGLALTRRIVEAHGGEVTLYNNREGRGLTVAVRWPRVIRTDLHD